jgi:hypothetical protein
VISSFDQRRLHIGLKFEIHHVTHIKVPVCTVGAYPLAVFGIVAPWLAAVVPTGALAFSQQTILGVRAQRG